MRTLLSLLLSAALFPAVAIHAHSTEDQVKASLALQGTLAYREILAAGAKAGRFYTREATASGTRRHVEEFVARQYVAPQMTTLAK